MPTHWLLKMIPYLDDLWAAIRARDMWMAFKILMTMIVYACVASGIVVLAGCGSIKYNSAGEPIYSQSSITRTDIVKPNDFEAAPSK